VAAHKTPRKLIEEALNVTESAKVLGLVFNADDRHLSRGYSYASRRPSDEYRDGRRRGVFGSRTFGRQTASDE
jgi:hypothetical protein